MEGGVKRHDKVLKVNVEEVIRERKRDHRRLRKTSRR